MDSFVKTETMAENFEHNFFEKLADHFVKRDCVKDNQRIISELQSGIHLSVSQSSRENNINSKMRAMSMHFEKDLEFPPEIRARSASCTYKTNTSDQVNITSQCNSSCNKTPVESKTPDRKKRKRKGPIELEDFQNDSFFQTLKTLQMEKKEPSGLEKAKEKLTTFMREGSEFLKKELPRLAAEKYKYAIDMILEANAELYDLKEMDFVTLQYALGHCYIETANYSDICRGIEIFVEIKKVHFSQFPTIYYALGSAYYKLNRFKVATQHLKTGLEFLEKKILFESYPWPGTNTIIRLTTRDGLKEDSINLLHLCQAYYLPDASCRYPQCLSINPHIIPSRNIFHTDPDFSGLIVVNCEENCKIEYHTFCWKNYKESLSSVEKLSEKNCLGKECPTNDCVTCDNKKSCIIRIEIYGEDGNLKSQCVKDMNNDQNSNKKSKKKREKLTSLNVPEKVKKKVKRERRVSEPLQDKNMNEPNTTQQPVNDLSYRLQRLAFLRERNFDCDVDQSWDPRKIYYGQHNIGNWEKFPINKYDSAETKATKDFIFSYFSDVLIENGPMEKQFVIKKWLKDFEDSKDLHAFLTSYNNDIIKFLLTSHQFALIEDTLCHSKDIPNAYNVTKTVLTESLLFVLNDCPTETVNSHNDNVKVNNNETWVANVPLLSAHIMPEINKEIIPNTEMNITKTEITDSVEVKDETNKSQLDTNSTPQIEGIFENKSENIGMQSLLNKIENENIHKHYCNENIHNYNQSLLDEVSDHEIKTNDAGAIQQTEVELNGLLMAPSGFRDVSGDSLSSNNADHANSYLLSAKPIFHMETLDNSVQFNTNDLSGEIKNKVIEIFLAEVELIFKNEFQVADEGTMERLKKLMYNYTKMNCKCSSLRDILSAFNEQMEISEIDKASMAVTVEEIKLNVLRTEEEIEKMKKTLTEKLCIQDLQLKKLITLIDKLKNKLAAAEKFNEVSSKEKVSFYRKKCETNIMYCKLLLQSGKAGIEAKVGNVMEKLKMSDDLLNFIVHLEGSNCATSEINNSYTEGIAVSNTSNMFRKIDEISDYIDIGIQKLLSITIKNYNNCNYGDAVENTANFYLYGQPEQINSGHTTVTSRNIPVSCYRNSYYNNVGEYYNLHRNLATLPLQQEGYLSPTYFHPINNESVVKTSLDALPQTNTLMENNLNWMSSGIHSGIMSQSPCWKSKLMKTAEINHLKPPQLFPKQCITESVFQPRTIIRQEDKSVRYKQLIDRLLYKYVTWERSEMEALLMSIRERRNGLSGMKLVEIFNLVEQEVQEKNKIYGGTMGMEKFGDSAWGGIKTNKVWSKPTDAALDDCVICMDQMTGDITSLQCKHSFHTKCIKDWLRTKKACPICQALALLHEEYPPLA